MTVQLMEIHFHTLGQTRVECTCCSQGVGHLPSVKNRQAAVRVSCTGERNVTRDDAVDRTNDRLSNVPVLRRVSRDIKGTKRNTEKKKGGRKKERKKARKVRRNVTGGASAGTSEKAFSLGKGEL